ncbi:MAG: tetratricopeptide repeat protein, partial [Thermoanaerobaculia bacterium]|nr:tetratricopeptide repeat protein [Thermoanaerobaculia bacterium]
AKLADLGIATEAEPGDQTTLAQADGGPGTVAYMSPEQALAKEVDARTDLFSLGAVLYEMATGRKAFTGDSTAAIFDAILNREPTAVPQINPNAPFELEQVIRKALTKDAALRYQTAADLAADLKRLLQQGDSSRSTSPSFAPVAQPASPQPSSPGEPSRAEAVPPQQAELPTEPSATAASSADVSGSSSRVEALDRAGAKHWKSIAAVVLVLGALGTYFLFRAESEPVLEEGTELVLADFVNTTGDPVFDGTLKQALSVKIAESPYLDVYPQDKMLETLSLMQRSPEEKITPEVAREICQRRGVKAMLSGEVATLGANYIVTLNAIDCGTGELLVGQQVEAGSKEEVLGALGTAITRMRGDLGESLASVEKYDVPIEQATTTSLQALQAFSQAVEERNMGRDFNAIPFFQRALELDPGFALAHARMGTAYNNTGQTQKSHEHWRRAYELREGVSEPERLYILAHYHADLQGDLRKGSEVYQQWAKIYPREWSTYNNLAIIQSDLGELDKALETARKALELNPDHAFPYGNVALSHARLGQIDEAREILAMMEDRGFGGPSQHLIRAFVEGAAGNEEGFEEALDFFTGTPGEPNALRLRGNWAARHGRVTELRALARREAELAADLTGDPGIATSKVELADNLLDLGYESEAAELAREALGLARDVDTLSDALSVLSVVGEPTEARQLIEELDERWPQNTIVQGSEIPQGRARLALRAGDAVEAIDVLETARPFERAELDTIRLRGQAYLANGEPEKAVGEFEKLIALDSMAPAAPVHTLARLWLGRAYLAAGDPTEARAAYEEFFEMMKSADEGVPVIEKAREEYATIPGVKG